ncbi:glycosyltransferase family 2 protein [Paucilactobacillus kaifaensis]|uniref:glycosyltransferase family 2 protein n=1 Tax=Paucilactobacillus kaifaensis TaxID=2559921 RepID=UPI0010F44BF5|nr:glycosyltransferase [Paucilactobacillus kaifaensis]
MNELISVIIPVYNVKKFLQQIINDLENQNFDNFEVLLIDDGSTDGSGSLCENICKKSPLSIHVVHQKNQGLSSARNTGINLAVGKYFTFIDPDDRIAPNFLSYLIKLIEKSDCLMSACSHLIVRGNRRSLGVDNATNYEVVSAYRFIEGLLYHRRFDTSAWAKMFHRSLFETIKFPEGKLYEDLATIYKLVIKAQNVCVGNEANYFYLIRDESITNTTFSDKQLDFIDVTQRMKTEVDRVFPTLSDATAERLTFSYISTLTKTFNSVENSELNDVQRKLVAFINKNKKSILNNHMSMLRDRLSVYLLTFFGLFGFRLLWNLYERVRRIL